MNALQNVITIAQCIQLVVVTFQNETKLAHSARLLMHSCQLYEDAVKTIKTTIEEKLASPAFAGKETAATVELQNHIKRINDQVSLDEALLKNILKETEAIKESKAKGGLMRNVFTSVASGRVDNIKEYSNQLMERFQVISALMMKDIWKSANAMDPALMDLINDTEGAMFWYGQFANERQVSFSLFVDAYQSYCTSVFLCRKFNRQHLLTLLRHSLLEQDVINDAALLSSEVSCSMFAQWLRRYGPMKDTLSKSCVVSSPDHGNAAPWFHKGMNRDAAVRQIGANLNKYSGGIQPHHMFVVRFSSDAKNHFVVTAQPPTSTQVENYPIINGPLGYSVVGEKGLFAPNLVECIQVQILDKMFAKALGTEITLSRSNVDDWETIITNLQVDLPSDHYKDVDALNAATDGLDLGDGGTGKSNATFGNLLGRTEPSRPKLVKKPADENKFVPAGSSTASEGVPLSAGEKSVVGNYMVNQGLLLLQQCGQISDEQVSKIRKLL